MERPVVARTFVGHRMASRVLNFMYEQTSNPSLSDLIVYSGGKTFPCHRAVLAASSPVFSAMFQSHMQEQENGELRLEDVPADVFAAVRAFMYGRPLRVHDDHALSLSAFVRRYEIANPELPDFLDALLTSALTLDNVLAVRDHADSHAAHRLRRNCDRFIATRMKVLPENPSFLSSAPAVAIAALRAPGNVSREVVGRKCAQYVFAAAVSWLLHDETNREQYRDTMLAAVDVEGLSLSALVRASRDPVALRSASFQARLLRAFARKAERDLNFDAWTGEPLERLSSSGAAGFMVVDDPPPLRGMRTTDDIGLFPFPASRALYQLRRRSTLTQPRLPVRGNGSSTSGHPSRVASSSTSESEGI